MSNLVETLAEAANKRSENARTLHGNYTARLVDGVTYNISSIFRGSIDAAQCRKLHIEYASCFHPKILYITIVLHVTRYQSIKHGIQLIFLA